MTGPVAARCPYVAKGRLEIAHFWQDVCLSISVRETDDDRPVETSLDAGPTRIRLRRVESVEALPRPSRWGSLGVPAALALLGGCAIYADDRAEPNILAIASRLAPPCDSCPIPTPSRIHSIRLRLESPRDGLDTEFLLVPGERPWNRPCVRGEVFAIANASRRVVTVVCSDPTVNAAPVASLGLALIAAPESLASCRFSSDGIEWRYSLAIRKDELTRRRPPPGADRCAPYTWHLQIDEDRILRPPAPHSRNLSFLPARPTTSPPATLHVESEGVVSTGLDPALVRAVVEKHLPQLQYCVDRRLAAHPGPTGDFLVEFTIAGDGFVSEARVEARIDEEVRSCLTTRFRAMRFPAPPARLPVEGRCPFGFAPGKGVQSGFR